MTDTADITIDRLEDQLTWYDTKAAAAQRMYKRLKSAMLIAAALIPVAALCPYGRVVDASLGALVMILEGFQQLGQYQQNWFTYRATAEALKHEKYLYLAPAGAYLYAENPRQLLAEQIESLVSQEHAKWSAAQEDALAKKRNQRPTML